MAFGVVGGGGILVMLLLFCYWVMNDSKRIGCVCVGRDGDAMSAIIMT